VPIGDVAVTGAVRAADTVRVGVAVDVDRRRDGGEAGMIAAQPGGGALAA